MALAKRNGHSLSVEDFTSLLDLRAKLEVLKADPTLDHIYIDGYTAINDMRWRSADIQSSFKANPFTAYGRHGDDMTALVQWVKEGTESSKNVFLTCALKASKSTGGTVVDVELECKGQMAVTAITKMGEAVVTVLQVNTESGPQRMLVTRSFDSWPGRIDGLLDDGNPGMIAPDLSIVLQLSKGI